MKAERQHDYDVVIIGKGIAGLTSAMEVSQNGSSVAVIYDNSDCSTKLAYEGVFRFTENSNELKEKIKEYDGGLAKPELLAHFIKAYKESCHDDLKQLFPLVNATPIGKKHRLGGPGILEDLETLCVFNKVKFINGKTVKICTSDGNVSAVQAFCFQRLITFRAKCVIIAAGGGIGNIYQTTNNAVSPCTSGAILALNAGARLRDMEFISFHPFGIIDHYTLHNTIPIFTFFNIGVKTNIYSKKTNQRVGFIEDLISSRTLQKNAHDNIFKIAQQVWSNEGIYFFKTRNNIQQKFEAKVVAHSLIGGIDTNSCFETSVNGLYSVGEATGGLNGASRIPGMALLEGFVSGKQAGKSASIYANNKNHLQINKDELIPSSTNFGMFSSLIDEIRRISDAAIFIERTEHDLLHHEEKLLSLIRRISRKELAQYIEYDIAELVLIIIKASLLRKESRGFFIRSEYENIDPGMEKSIVVEKKTPTSEAHVLWE